MGVTSRWIAVQWHKGLVGSRPANVLGSALSRLHYDLRREHDNGSCLSDGLEASHVAACVPVSPIPEETMRVARAAFPHGNVYMRIRDEDVRRRRVGKQGLDLCDDRSLNERQ